MSTGVAVRTPSGRQQLPCRAGFFLVLPRQMAGEQVERIDLLRVRLGTGLKIGANQFLGFGFAE